jgi:hypothetical protein
MAEISKEELDKLDEHLTMMSAIIEGDDEFDGLALYYETCSNPKRLYKILSALQFEYNRIYDMFSEWYSREK